MAVDPRREVRLLVFAHLHLDRAFPWAAPEAGQEARAARQLALDALCSIADAEADVLVSAGDLYDQEHHHPDTGELLREAFERLTPMPVLLVPGTSDPPGRTSLYERVPWSENVTVLAADQPAPVEVAPNLTVWGAAGREAFATFAAPGLGQHVGLTHWAPPPDVERTGLLHLISGEGHVPQSGQRVAWAGAVLPAGGADGGGSFSILSVFDDGTVAVTQRPLEGEGPQAPPHRFSADGLAEFDLALLGEEQTVRGEFVRDLLATGDPADLHVRRLALLAGLRALGGTRPRLGAQTAADRNGGHA